MTPKQAKYVQHRAAGLGQAQAARAAGYASASAKGIACRMEKLPAIQDAINEARRNRNPGHDADAEEFDSAQSYLSAVVRGTTPPDPVRVGAARALLPFERARQRAPIQSKTPAQMGIQDKTQAEQAALDAWERKAAAVIQKMKSK